MANGNGTLRTVIVTVAAAAIIGIGGFIGNKAVNAASKGELDVIEMRVEFLEKQFVQNNADHQLILYQLTELTKLMEVHIENHEN